MNCTMQSSADSTSNSNPRSVYPVMGTGPGAHEGSRVFVN